MKINTIACDGCGLPIDLDKGTLEFRPLRGGLDILITGAKPADEKLKAEVIEHPIREQVHLHGVDCFPEYVERIQQASAKKKTEAAAKAAAAKAAKAAVDGKPPVTETAAE